jgi:phosphoribosylamine--glycine ligase
MARRGTPFRGVLFAGLMLTASGPEADRVQRPLRRPECQALMLRLSGDLLPVLRDAAAGRLARAGSPGRRRRAWSW